MIGRLIGTAETKTEEEIEQTALGGAGAFAELGVRPGDRVLLKGDNSPDYVLALLALMHVGASLVLVDHRQSADEVRRVVDLAGVSWSVVHSEDAQQAADNSDLFFDRVVNCANNAEGRLTFHRWWELNDALIAWSSGSTDEPKGVVRSGRSLRDNIERTQRRMGYRPEDVLLPLLPFSHQYGLSLVLLSVTAGCSLLVSPSTSLTHAIRMAGQVGATVLDATPPTFRSLLNLFERQASILTDLGTIRMWCTGGAPLDPRLAARFSSWTGLPLLDGYGSTEGGNIALAVPEHPVGCGQPLDGVSVRIATEKGGSSPPGGIGEIWVRSPDLLEGYLTSQGVSGPAADEWFCTGDLGYMDADGHLHVVGRKFAIHRLGHTLYPQALARKASNCGHSVQVVPVADQRLGHRLVFVVEDPDGASAREANRRFGSLLSSYERPDHVVVVPSFPRTQNGKVDHVRLAHLATEAL